MNESSAASPKMSVGFAWAPTQTPSSACPVFGNAETSFAGKASKICPPQFAHIMRAQQDQHPQGLRGVIFWLKIKISRLKIVVCFQYHFTCILDNFSPSFHHSSRQGEKSPKNVKKIILFFQSIYVCVGTAPAGHTWLSIGTWGVHSWKQNDSRRGVYVDGVNLLRLHCGYRSQRERLLATRQPIPLIVFELSRHRVPRKP